VSALPPEETGAVRGERGSALVDAARSVQARVSNVLTAGLMICIGVGALSWYYAHVFTRHSQPRQAAAAGIASRAQGEMPLPSLGPISPPSPPPPAVQATSPVAAAAEAPLAETPVAPAATDLAAVAHPVSQETPAEAAHQRRLSGAVFAHDGQPGSAAGGGERPAGGGGGAHETGDGAGTLASWLTPSVTPAVQAQILPNARLLLPKGAFIDCTLETAIDSTLPGMTTCITAADTFGADGKVVLLERGTKLVGETRGQVQQGQARIFVVWSEARTPAGVVVPLASPGTDELGRAGLPGEVQRHFWQRFGAAILVSVINGAVQAGVQAANRSGGSVIYAPSSSADVMSEALKDTVGIAPTIVKHNGDRIQVLVARDVDFRPVYELRTAALR